MNWIRGGSITAATSKVERFVIMVNGFQPLAITTKRSISDVAAVLDPPLWIKLNRTSENINKERRERTSRSGNGKVTRM